MDVNGRLLPAEVGDSMPLWYYDHEKTAWIDEGALAYVVEDAESVTGFVLEGEVTHFSHRNCDTPCPNKITKVTTGGCPTPGYYETTTTTIETVRSTDENGDWIPDTSNGGFWATHEETTTTTVKTDVDCGPWVTL